MPVVPVDQNRVALSDGVSARFRTPDLSGTGLEAVGRGLAQLGQAGAEYAQVQDQIQDHADRISARDAALRAQGDMNGALMEYTALQGKAATEQGAATQKRIDEIRAQYVQAAGNDRQRRYLGELLGAQTLQANNAIAEHSKRELFAYTKSTYASGVTLAQQSAAQFRDDPQMADKAKAEGFDYLAKLGHLEGWDENTAKLKGLEYTSGIHNAVLDTMKAAPVPDVTAIQDYVAKHGDEMTLDARNNIAGWLQKPLQERRFDDIFLAASTGAKSAPGTSAAYQSPVAGGKVTNTFAQHQERGSVGYDIAAPMGSAIHPIAEGVVTQVREDARAGKWVMVKHPDGTTSTYAHMGNQSVKVGDEVSAQTVLGTVGMTGHTTGPHVHLRTRDAEGNDVDPAKLIGAKPAITGTTTAARNYDQAAVVANIKAMGLNPEEERGAIDYAVTKMNKSQSLLADQQRDAGDQALKVIIGLGDRFTDVNQIPAAIRAKADFRDLANWKEAADRNRDAQTQIPKDGARSIELQIMSRANPDAFLGVNLAREVGKVSPDELKSFALKQAELVGQRNRPQTDNHRSAITTAINWAKKYGGTEISDTDFPRVFDAAEAYLRAKGITAATAKDADEAVRSAMRDVPMAKSVLGIPYSGTRKAYEIDSVSQIPGDTLARIDKALTQTLGRAPNDKERLAMYQRLIVP